MNNVIRFPDQGPHAKTAEDHAHAVQFYDGEEFLFQAVNLYLVEGLRAGDSMIVIATAAHKAGFVRQLEASGDARASKDGRVLFLDARDTLATFLVDDMPDRDLFHDMLDRTITTLGKGARVRAYGEMVDVLWRDGNSRGAIRLEELWNEACEARSFSLLCAYQMGNFYREGDAARFLEVCRNHSHVIPTESFSSLDDANARLREISMLQQRGRSLENEIENRKRLEVALRDALRERSRVEDELRSSLAREKLAREAAEASDTFKEMFLAMLGHDLRNPLNTILTTARLMLMRKELSAENEKRVERLVSSGERMHRMIAQILDVTHARLGEGIPVAADEECDLSDMVAKLVEETRAASPGRAIEVDLEPLCMARVDRGRIEQVIANVLGNAMTHGDAEAPVRVEVARRGETVGISVHNRGAPVDPSDLPLLFDPFRRAKPNAGSKGLGLGLYISQAIVRAHGGEILVDSGEGGTLFEIVLPRRL